MSRFSLEAARRLFIGLLFALPSFSTASAVTTSWLTVTPPPAGNQFLLAGPGSHPLTLPGYGPATVSVTSTTGSGGLALRSYAYYAPAVFSGFSAQGLDPTGFDNYAIYGGTTPLEGNSVTVSFDFSTLTTGYLPAGAIFMVVDIDTFEAMRDLRASLNNTQYTTPWLSLKSQFDADGTNDVSAYSAFTESVGFYDFPPNLGNYDVGAQYFLTTVNIDRVDFMGLSDYNPRGFLVAFGVPVPEPGSLALVGLAALASLGGRQRRRES
jgi:hypothetical protein